MLIITKENIHEYRTGSHPEVNQIRWDAGLLDASVLRRFPSLQWLDCSIRLNTLKCLEGCPTLRTLHCNNAGLISLAGIEACPLLEDLYVNGNHLKTLAGIELCPRLWRLYCSLNNLTSLRSTGVCPSLQVLHCDANELMSLCGIEMYPSLRYLDCYQNWLGSLQGIEACTKLEYLFCSNNPLRSLDSIVYLRHLRRIQYEGSTLDLQTPRVERLLARLKHSMPATSIYDNGQNVHDPRVQRSVRESLQNLLTDSKPTFSIDYVINSELDEKTKQLLTEYCLDESIHSDHLLTYAELLAYVWNRIIRSEHATEMLRILEEQIADAECKCFTGRFNRTISVLVGFYSDITIEISDSSRISAIMIAIQNRLDPYDSQVHLKTARVELIEAGYTAEEIEPWLRAISEP